MGYVFHSALSVFPCSLISGPLSGRHDGRNVSAGAQIYEIFWARAPIGRVITVMMGNDVRKSLEEAAAVIADFLMNNVWTRSTNWNCSEQI